MDKTGTSRELTTTRALRILFTCAGIVLLLDQLSKALVVSNMYEGQSFLIIPNFFSLYFVRNSGAAFSLGSEITWIFTILGIAVLVVAIFYAKKIRFLEWSIVLGVFVGGLTGNLLDRLFRPPGIGIGHVVDFFHIHFFPAIFNVADIAIVVSAGLFVILSFRFQAPGDQIDTKEIDQT